MSKIDYRKDLRLKAQGMSMRSIARMTLREVAEMLFPERYKSDEFELSDFMHVH